MAPSPTTHAATNSKDADAAKPLTGYAPPPVSAVISMAFFLCLSLYYLPNDTVVPPELFVNRVFPEYMSVEALLYLRGFFALVCFGGFASAWVTPP